MATKREFAADHRQADRQALMALIRFPSLISSCRLDPHTIEEASTRMVLEALINGNASLGRDPDTGAVEGADLSFEAGLPESWVDGYPSPPATIALAVQKLELAQAYADASRELGRIRAFSQPATLEKLDRRAPMKHLSTQVDEIAKRCALKEPGIRHGERSAEEMIHAAGEKAIAAHESTGKATTRGLPWCIEDLDAVSFGLLAGEITLVASRTTIGKSTLAFWWAERWTEMGSNGIYFSAEMRDHTVELRIGHSLVGVPTGSRSLSAQHGRQLIELAAKRKADKSRGRWIYCSPPSLMMDYVRPRLHQAVDEGVDWVVIDNLENLDKAQRGEKDYERVTRVWRDLRILAGETGVHLIVLHHLGREADKLPAGKCPEKSMIKDSGKIEDTTDNIFFLRRGDVRSLPIGHEPSKFGVSDFFLAKDRSSGLSDPVRASMMFDKSTQGFLEMSGDQMGLEA